MADSSQLVSSVLTGPLSWGLFFSAILFGCTTFQSLSFLVFNKRDPGLQKLYVVLIWVLDGSQLAVVSHLVYYDAYVRHATLGSPVLWSLPVYLLLQKILLSLTQGGYILRLWRLRPQQPWIPAILVSVYISWFSRCESCTFSKQLFLVISNFVLGMYLSVALFGIPEYGTLLLGTDRACTISLAVNFSLSSLADILIAGILMYTLVKAGTNLAWTESVTVMIFAYILNTGMIVGAISFIRIISIFVLKDASFAIEAVMTKLYVLCFIAMLNARLYLQKSQKHDSEMVFKWEDQSEIFKGEAHTPPTATINEVGLPLFPTRTNKAPGVENIEVKVEKQCSSSEV